MSSKIISYPCIQVFIYSYQRGKFQQHLPHKLSGSDAARIFHFYFSKICNMFFKKVQQSYRYTKLCNYREEFVHKPISNISSILVCWNLSLTWSLNVFTFKWMHNLQQIEHCQRRKKKISCFSSSTLHAVKFLL